MPAIISSNMLAPAGPLLEMPPASALAARLRALEAAFHAIGRERMAGVPVMHPGLRVQALGFEWEPSAEQAPGAASQIASGILLTPWFMNLLRLPLARVESAGLGLGQKAIRPLGAASFEFIGAYESELGAYESCSLFSPMFAFADQAAAVATAQALLSQLREPPAQGPLASAHKLPIQPAMASPVGPQSQLPGSAAASSRSDLEPVPSRRGFLFGSGRGGR